MSAASRRVRFVQTAEEELERAKAAPAGASRARRSATPTSSAPAAVAVYASEEDAGDSEDACFYCKSGGTVMICDVRGCGKVYHPTCLGYEPGDDEKFVCPHHACAVCGARDKQVAGTGEAQVQLRKCTSCPTAYCPHHVPDDKLYKAAAASAKPVALADGALSALFVPPSSVLPAVSAPPAPAPAVAAPAVAAAIAAPSAISASGSGSGSDGDSDAVMVTSGAPSSGTTTATAATDAATAAATGGSGAAEGGDVGQHENGDAFEAFIAATSPPADTSSVATSKGRKRPRQSPAASDSDTGGATSGAEAAERSTSIAQPAAAAATTSSGSGASSSSSGIAMAKDGGAAGGARKRRRVEGTAAASSASASATSSATNGESEGEGDGKEGAAATGLPPLPRPADAIMTTTDGGEATPAPSASAATPTSSVTASKGRGGSGGSTATPSSSSKAPASATTATTGGGGGGGRGGKKGSATTAATASATTAALTSGSGSSSASSSSSSGGKQPPFSCPCCNSATARVRLARVLEAVWAQVANKEVRRRKAATKEEGGMTDGPEGGQGAPASAGLLTASGGIVPLPYVTVDQMNALHRALLAPVSDAVARPLYAAAGHSRVTLGLCPQPTTGVSPTAAPPAAAVLTSAAAAAAAEEESASGTAGAGAGPVRTALLAAAGALDPRSALSVLGCALETGAVPRVPTCLGDILADIRACKYTSVQGLLEDIRAWVRLCGVVSGARIPPSSSTAAATGNAGSSAAIGAAASASASASAAAVIKEAEDAAKPWEATHPGGAAASFLGTPPIFPPWAVGEDGKIAIEMVMAGVPGLLAQMPLPVLTNNPPPGTPSAALSVTPGVHMPLTRREADLPGPWTSAYETYALAAVTLADGLERQLLHGKKHGRSVKDLSAALAAAPAQPPSAFPPLSPLPEAQFNAVEIAFSAELAAVTAGGSGSSGSSSGKKGGSGSGRNSPAAAAAAAAPSGPLVRGSWLLQLVRALGISEQEALARIYAARLSCSRPELSWTHRPYRHAQRSLAQIATDLAFVSTIAKSKDPEEAVAKALAKRRKPLVGLPRAKQHLKKVGGARLLLDGGEGGGDGEGEGSGGDGNGSDDDSDGGSSSSSGGGGGGSSSGSRSDDEGDGGAGGNSSSSKRRLDPSAAARNVFAELEYLQRAELLSRAGAGDAAAAVVAADGVLGCYDAPFAAFAAHDLAQQPQPQQQQPRAMEEAVEWAQSLLQQGQGTGGSGSGSGSSSVGGNGLSSLTKLHAPGTVRVLQPPPATATAAASSSGSGGEASGGGAGGRRGGSSLYQQPTTAPATAVPLLQQPVLLPAAVALSLPPLLPPLPLAAPAPSPLHSQLYGASSTLANNTIMSSSGSVIGSGGISGGLYAQASSPASRSSLYPPSASASASAAPDAGQAYSSNSGYSWYPPNPTGELYAATQPLAQLAQPAPGSAAAAAATGSGAAATQEVARELQFSSQASITSPEHVRMVSTNNTNSSSSAAVPLLVPTTAPAAAAASDGSSPAPSAALLLQIIQTQQQQLDRQSSQIAALQSMVTHVSQQIAAGHSHTTAAATAAASAAAAAAAQAVRDAASTAGTAAAAAAAAATASSSAGGSAGAGGGGGGGAGVEIYSYSSMASLEGGRVSTVYRSAGEDIRSALSRMTPKERQVGLILSELAPMDVDADLKHLRDFLPPSPEEVMQLFGSLTGSLRRSLVTAGELRSAWIASRRGMMPFPAAVDVERRYLVRLGAEGDVPLVEELQGGRSAYAGGAAVVADADAEGAGAGAGEGEAGERDENGLLVGLGRDPQDPWQLAAAGGGGIVTLGEGRIALERELANRNLRAQLRKYQIAAEAQRLEEAHAAASGVGLVAPDPFYAAVAARAEAASSSSSSSSSSGEGEGEDEGEAASAAAAVAMDDAEL